MKKKSKKRKARPPVIRPRAMFLDTETTGGVPQPKVETGDLIALICKAASERWPEDKSAPGIQIAHIPERLGRAPLETEVKIQDATWYLALHRYAAPAGQDRIVAFKTTSDDLDAGLLEVAVYVATPTPMRAELAKVLK